MLMLFNIDLFKNILKSKRRKFTNELSVSVSKLVTLKKLLICSKVLLLPSFANKVVAPVIISLVTMTSPPYKTKRVGFVCLTNNERTFWIVDHSTVEVFARVIDVNW